MATYDYRAVWMSSLPDPRGIWHIRVYDPATAKVLICHNGLSECSLVIPGDRDREAIETEVILFLAKREAEIADWPPPLTGTVNV